MNISEQLNLLLNIKESLKLKLIETGAKITDLTPFKDYSKYISKPEKNEITDGIFANNQPSIVKENVFGINTDEMILSNQPTMINENILILNTDSVTYKKLEQG